MILSWNVKRDSIPLQLIPSTTATGSFQEQRIGRRVVNVTTFSYFVGLARSLRVPPRVQPQVLLLLLPPKFSPFSDYQQQRRNVKIKFYCSAATATVCYCCSCCGTSCAIHFRESFLTCPSCLLFLSRRRRVTCWSRRGRFNAGAGDTFA